MMQRRSFIRNAGLAGLIAGAGLSATGAKAAGAIPAGADPAEAIPAGADPPPRVPPRVPPHNWENYDFGAPPSVSDRLNQGPFTAYGADATAPGAEVVMVTGPSGSVVPNRGMGLVTYLCDEAGPPRVDGETLETSIEKLAGFPLGNKLYLRVDWRDIQKQPGKLDFPDHWKIAFDMALKYNKQVGLRIQLMSPVIEGHSVPGFLVDRIPFVELGKTGEIGIPGKVHAAPRYDHPAFMAAFRELDDLLAEAYNGHELVEFVDTFMYGFWGEGHTWPFAGNPFPDYHTAEQTSIALFEHQARNWDKTPLLTNTQPDYSHVGNSEVLDRTIRSHNWLRTDTIFIENEQIDALSNRPSWTGALVENGISTGDRDSDHIIRHARDVSPHYFSLWNWHNISVRHLQNYYSRFPVALNDLALSIGYRLRPSWIWYYEKESYPTLILGLVNDGIAGVPGVLRLSMKNDQGILLAEGSLDAGYPVPGKVRQAELTLPQGTRWEGLRLVAEIEIKTKRYPVRWACREELNEDGSLTLARNLE